MSTYKTVRGKWVKHDTAGITTTLKVDPDGTLHIRVNGIGGPNPPNEVMDLSESAAGNLYNLLGDVMEWESSRGITESELERMGDEADAESGELDDSRAASNK